MHLTRLKIHALPGIEPGFEFQPAAKSINIVIGPNASGKSSLVRALTHLLQPQNGDPPALSLEAEFYKDNAHWQVQRNGSQVVWTRNGEAADQPALPAAGQLGMYRLAMEHLLTDDQGDREIARELLRTLHRGFDLGEPRIDLTTQFAAPNATALRQARETRREVERRHEDLRQQEAELPALDTEIAAAENAQRRCERLNQVIALYHAIRNHKDQAETLKSFPPEMGQLLGAEVGHLEELEERLQDLRADLQDHKNNLTTHQAELRRTGLEKSRPKRDEVAANKERLQRIRDKSIERKNAEKTVDCGGGGRA